MSSQRDRAEALAEREAGAPRTERMRPGMPHWAGLSLYAIALRVMQPLYSELERRAGILRDEAATIVCLAVTTAETAQEVVRSTGRPKNSISRAVISLEDRGLITRTAHPMDGRASSLQLTAAGKAMFEDIRNDYGAADERLLGTLEPAERRQFLDLLAKVSARSAEWD